MHALTSRRKSHDGNSYLTRSLGASATAESPGTSAGGGLCLKGSCVLLGGDQAGGGFDAFKSGAVAAATFRRWKYQMIAARVMKNAQPTPTPMPTPTVSEDVPVPLLESEGPVDVEELVDEGVVIVVSLFGRILKLIAGKSVHVIVDIKHFEIERMCQIYFCLHNPVPGFPFCHIDCIYQSGVRLTCCYRSGHTLNELS